jgi:hypothetical protein
MAPERFSPGTTIQLDYEETVRSATIFDKQGDPPKLVDLHGQPCLWFARSGDVHAIHDTKTVSILPEGCCAESLQGPPVGHAAPGAIFATGHHILLVGQDTMSVIPSHCVFDAHVRGDIASTAWSFNLRASDAGFTRFLPAYGWLDEDRLVVAGVCGSSPGCIGVRTYRVSHDDSAFSVNPETEEVTVLPGEVTDAAINALHGNVHHNESTDQTTFFITAADMLWSAKMMDGMLQVDRAYRRTAHAIDRSEVIASTNANDTLLIVRTEHKNHLGFPQGHIEKWVLKSDGAITIESVRASKVFNKAELIMAGASRYIALTEPTGRISVYGPQHLERTRWCEIEPEYEDFFSAIGPDYVGAIGKYGDKAFLFAAPIHQDRPPLESSGSVGAWEDGVEHDVLACPNVMAVLRIQHGRATVDVHRVMRNVA